MGYVNIYVNLKDGRRRYYEVNVNKFADFENVFKDSFMQWQIFEMSCKPSSYHFCLQMKKYLEFFKDFLSSEYDLNKDGPDIVSVYTCSENLNEHDHWITVGGHDEKWE